MSNPLDALSPRTTLLLGIALMIAGAGTIAYGASVPRSQCLPDPDPTTGEERIVCTDFSGDWAIYLYPLGALLMIAGFILGWRSLRPRRARQPGAP